MKRSVKKAHRAIEAHMPGLSTWQALPNHGVQHIDPFILLNHHGPETFPPNNNGLPFGPHPHRGFETLTFIFAGDIVHKDSGGHESKITAGGVQWMTAGSGLIHSEVSSQSFKEQGGEEEVLQLWLNLPQKLKMTEPYYRGLSQEELTHIELPQSGVSIHLISGELEGKSGPHKSITDLTMAYIDIPSGASHQLEVSEEEQIFFYVVNGHLTVNGLEAAGRQLVEFAQEGSVLEIEAQKDSRIIFGSGKPYGEPIVAQGPFVMNYPGEIKQAWLDYQAGKLGSWS